ncbi:unnamed protein product [Victoria cruziana]
MRVRSYIFFSILIPGYSLQRMEPQQHCKRWN